MADPDQYQLLTKDKDKMHNAADREWMNYGLHQKGRRQKQTTEPQMPLIWHFYRHLPIFWGQILHFARFDPWNGKSIMTWACYTQLLPFPPVRAKTSPAGCLPLRVCTIFVQFISLHSIFWGIFWKQKALKWDCFVTQQRQLFLGRPIWNENFYHYHNQSSILFSILFNRMKDINICVAIVLI